MFSLVIFDLDGTLADSFPWFLGVVNGVAREYGFRPIAEADVEPLRRAGTRDILRRHDVPLWKLPAIGRRMRALKREQVASIPLFPGAPEMLRALSDAGLTLALVSSDNEDNARRQLGASAAHFSHFACGASLFGKAAKFKSILRRARVAPAQAIAIGDEMRDIEAARDSRHRLRRSHVGLCGTRGADRAQAGHGFRARRGHRGTAGAVARSPDEAESAFTRVQSQFTRVCDALWRNPGHLACANRPGFR